jgi:hypothetical protein
MKVPFALFWLWPFPLAAADPIPLPQAHAHNDYEHRRPLMDALEHGFCSVEADVWLVNGRLLVAHDLKDARPERTLEKLYLDPLRRRVEENGGRIFGTGPAFTLLIDVKSDATNTYLALREVLRRYQKILTEFHPEETQTNAVTVIISGNRARDLMAKEPSRLAAYDGRLADLESGDSRHLIPLISDNWSVHFKWRAGKEEGGLPETERLKLRQMANRAHQQGRRLRLWGAPDSIRMWSELLKEDVDFINTDDLDGLQKFLISSKRER